MFLQVVRAQANPNKPELTMHCCAKCRNSNGLHWWAKETSSWEGQHLNPSKDSWPDPTFIPDKSKKLLMLTSRNNGSAMVTCRAQLLQRQVLTSLHLPKLGSSSNASIKAWAPDILKGTSMLSSSTIAHSVQCTGMERKLPFEDDSQSPGKGGRP